MSIFSKAKEWIMHTEKQPAPVESVPGKMEARHGHAGVAHYISFDGEKNVGEIGPVIDYELDYYRLSLRSWQSYLENDISKTILDKYTVWMIGKGLKLQSEPVKLVLENAGINIDIEKFNSIVEARFNLWAKSKHASFTGMQSLNEISKEAFKNAKIGGDVLVVLRFKSKRFTVELIDGSRVRNDFRNLRLDRGNRIIDGVEIEESGRHVAYHIPGDINTKPKVIKAWSKSTGLRMAFLVLGARHRLGNVRGIPKIATSLETLKKLERYKEAAVGSAEERQKVPYFFTHSKDSDGENPLDNQIAQMIDGHQHNHNGIPVDEQGEALANKVAATTNKQVYNMPVGADLKVPDSKQELHFKEFHGTNKDGIAATIGIPPNIAFSKYDDSFSASRASTKDFDHSMIVERADSQDQYYSYIYNFWFHIEVLMGKISAPGYLVAFQKKDFMVVEAYLNSIFTGSFFPHIDPVKEVTASRLKLGDAMKATPLSTVERETDIVSEGDSISNITQAATELELAKSLGLEAQESQESQSGHEDEDDDDD